MKIIVDFIESFMNLFETGATTFISWMTGIVPIILMMMILINSIISLIGDDKVEKFAKRISKNSFARNFILPVFATFILGNPMANSIGKFLPEYYKPSYFASAGQSLHTPLGLFPHINPGEIFIYLGIAAGITQLGLNTAELALRYFVLGVILNGIGGVVTDFTTAFVCKSQGKVLSKDVVLRGDE